LGGAIGELFHPDNDANPMLGQFIPVFHWIGVEVLRR
jgi:hypothetical protein